MDNQTDRPRCIRCGVPAYGSVVFAPLCPFCQHSDDVAEAETEKKRHAAEMAAHHNDTPTEASFRQGWRDMLRGNTRPIAELWDDIPDSHDGSDITPITGSAEGDALMYGEDADSPEVGELFDDLAGWEDE